MVQYESVLVPWYICLPSLTWTEIHQEVWLVSGSSVYVSVKNILMCDFSGRGAQINYGAQSLIFI